MGGDHDTGGAGRLLPVGSPPHGRGPPSSVCLDAHPYGLTPAWAGTTGYQSGRCTASRAHPRMGGDHCWAHLEGWSNAGSPPHGRGPPHSVARDDGRVGLTPAWAGTTEDHWVMLAVDRAHPRMGGDHSEVGKHIAETLGSPPHGRGPPECQPRPEVRRGLTPAWAGTTTSSAGAATPATAHPRMGGDHRDREAVRRVVLGSPPHGRGPL